MSRFLVKTEHRDIRKITALFLSAVFILAVVFSVYFIAAESNHDCSGQDCEVCIFVHQCETSASQMDAVAAVVLLPLLLLVLLLVLPMLSGIFVPRTLVRENIRLNN